MSQVVRYGDPALRITPTFNGKRRPPVQKYGKVGNMPSDESETKKSKTPSPIAVEILAALMQLPLFVWMQQRFEEEQQLGSGKLLGPQDILATPIDPPRQQYQRAAQPVRYESDRIDPARYAKLVTAGRTYRGDRTMANVEAGQESRMHYQKHQQAIADDCVRARRLALDSGCTFEQAMRTLGVQSLALPS